MSKFISLANKYFLIFIFLVFSATLIYYVNYSYQSGKKNAHKEKYNDLKIYSNLIKQQIISWIDNAKLYSKEVSDNIQTKEIVNNLLLNPENEANIQKLNILKSYYCQKFKSETILIIHPNSMTEIGESQTNEKIDVQTIKFLKKLKSSKSKNEIVVYYCKLHNKLHHDIISEVFNEKNELIAYLIVRYDPHQSIFKIVENWDSTYNTLESFVVKREGDSVVFLNNLRFRENKMSQMKASLNNIELPAVKAVLNFNEIYEGIDYRGKEVVAYGNKIENTDWYLITKIDQDELFSDLKKQAFNSLILVALSIFALTILLFFLYNLTQKKIFRELYFKERSLQETNELFRTTLYSIGDAVISTDINGKIKHMNPIAEKLTGYFENEVLGTPINTIFKIINEDSRKKVENPVDIVLEKGLIVGLANHTLLISKDGNETPIADSGAPIRDVNGNIIGVVLVFRDQSEHHLAEKLIKESEEQYRLLFNNMLNGFALHEIITDENNIPVDYRFLKVNPAFEKILNCKGEDIIGKRILEVYPTTEDYWIKKYGDVALKNEIVQFENYSSVFDKHFKVYAFSPKPGFFATVFEDITTQNQVLIDLQNAKLKAEESDRLKTSFLNNISHEIRTPLNAIVGFTGLLKDNDLTEDRKENFIDVILKSSNQLLSIITDIINISTIDAGHIKLNKSEVNIGELLNEICETSTNNHLKSDIAFVKDIDTVKDLYLVCDKTKLSQIITNLLINAFKFTKKGYVRIYAETHDNQLKIIVKDTGIGVHKNDFDKIFERFRQANDTISTEFGGTGLGLSISKSYVDLMQGKITVSSELGKGSTFEVVIPIELRSGKQSFELKPNHYLKLKTTPRNILIVEDEYFNYLLMCSYLDDFNFNIVHAKNGKEAIDFFSENEQFDLILMDIKLPEMDGYEATRRIKDINPNIKIVAVTAFALHGDREKAFTNRCDDYLAKPIEKDKLIELLEKYLNN